MVYIKSDGTVSSNPPLHKQFFRLIVGVFAFVIFFFKSLLGFDTSGYSTGSTSNRSGGSSLGGGSSGGGGGGSRPFGPGGRPNIRTMGDINPPTVRGGGCPGGGCGM
ncbi:uncharacterized protein LOC143203557 [Rhynchophorus ferrugineus]|uniref:uncharacterized protein LOC143203557 n=1 Tax=Rhynchophorus ferrugineus TaxID=354439 RepID=UPI003FCD1597